MNSKPLIYGVLAFFIAPALAACSGAPDPTGNSSAPAPPIASATSSTSASYVRNPSWTLNAANSLGGPEPTGWQGAPGWVISGNVTQVFGLKSGLAVVDAGVVTTYDRHSQIVANSSVPSNLLLGDPTMPAPHLYAAYTKGHPYLMMVIPGMIKPVGDGTSKAPAGVYYAVFDAESGKLLAENTWEGTTSKLTTANAGGGVFIIQDPGTPHATKAFINPATGKVEDSKPSPLCVSGEVNCPIWRARVDGVDIVGINQSVQGSTWSVPNSYYNDSYSPVGPYIPLTAYPGAGRSHIVDVHTGKTPAWAKGFVGIVQSGNSYGSGAPPYYGVVALSDSEEGPAQSYVNTVTGDTATVGKDDTFVGEFVAADGKVYGSATPTSPTLSYPAVLDLVTKKPTILTQIPDLSVVAVSGDGIIVLKSGGPKLASSSDSGTGTQHLYILSNQDSTP